MPAADPAARPALSAVASVSTVHLIALGSAILILALAAVTGTARLLRARRRAELRLHEIVVSLPGEIFQYRIDAQGQASWEFLDRRGTFSRAVQAPKASGQGRGAILIDPDDERAFAAAAERASAEHAAFEIDLRIGPAGQGQRWVHSTAVRTPSPEGTRTWTGYWTDITASKHSEIALRHAMSRLEQAQHVARLGDWSYDFATGRVEWSTALYTLFQRDPQSGPPDFQESLRMFGEDGAAAIGAAIERSRTTGQTQRYDLHTTLPSGARLDVEVIAIPWRDADGRMVGLKGTLQDVTERRRLDESLLEAKELADTANRAKSLFLAAMSHEIRTPMYGMMGLLELLGLTPLSDDQRATLEVVSESGRALKRVIDDILDFSKIEAGKLELLPEPTSMARVVEGVHRVFAGSASARGLILTHHCDPQIGSALWVDGLRLRQILGNFVSNALKFTPKGRIELRAELVARHAGRQRIRLIVSDTGIGMTPDQQQRVFEPFVQAEHSLASRSGGTGLGLAICARLAERMQARLSMQSEVGVGTRMTLELELAEASAEQLAQASDPAMAEDHAPTRLHATRLRTPPSKQEAEACGQLVLVVDDHPINRMVLEGQLNRLGYATDTAEDGAIALAKLQRRRYGLVITDCNMPEMNGYQLAAALRDWESRLRRPRTPLVACTANALGGEIERCLEAGMDDYLAKPSGLAHLAEKLDRWLPLDDSGDSPLHEPTDAEPAPLCGSALDELVRSSGNDPKQLVATFRRTNEADAARLLAAACQLDLDAVARAAHRMKGAVRMLGARELGAVCGDIEAASRAGDADGVRLQIPRFKQALERLDQFLVQTY